MIIHRTVIREAFLHELSMPCLLNGGRTQLPADLKGSLSFRQYLYWMSEMGFYADYPVLHALALMWGVRITVLNGLSLREVRILHNEKISRADIRLLYDGQGHYSVIGECLLIVGVVLSMV